MKCVTWRLRVVQVGFWILMIYIAFSSTGAIVLQLGWISPPSRAIPSVQAEAARQLPGASVSEMAFAEQFVREYFFWTQGKEEARAARLKPFWKKGIDGQGGVDFHSASWNSYTRHVNVWQKSVRNDPSGIMDITVYAETILTNIHHPEEQKRVDRYLIVSMRQAGASYVVVEIPHLVPPPVASVSTEAKWKKEHGEPVNDTVRGQIARFMQSFWKVYTTGEPQEIAYFYKNNQPVQGLTGILKWKEVRQLSVVQEKGQTVVECEVVLEDLASKAEMVFCYSFELTQERDHWYVVKMGEGEEAL
jgi:hypothetical protein